MTHVLVTTDDAGARVRVYRDNVLMDDYYVHAEDDSWRSHVPADATLTVR